MIKISIGGDKNYTKLSIFDFDGTLFKSPERPKNFRGNWWSNKESLDEPHVPKTPDTTFWNNDVVDKAKQELSSKNTLTVMMTGRIGTIFKDRVLELLSGNSISFPLVKFGEFGEDTGEVKIAEINRLLKKYPLIKTIEMWEDDEEKVELYKEKYSTKYNLKINKIN